MARPTDLAVRESSPGEHASGPAGACGGRSSAPGCGTPPLLRLDPVLRGRLERLASEGYPHEVCGLLVGTPGTDVTSVERVTRARNSATDRPVDRYVLHPDDFLAADLDARREGLDIVGIWHTHPDHPARPSETDLSAAWEGYTYLILAVRREGVADLTAWRLVEGSFVEQPVEEARA